MNCPSISTGVLSLNNIMLVICLPCVYGSNLQFLKFFYRGKVVIDDAINPDHDFLE